MSIVDSPGFTRRDLVRVNRVDRRARRALLSLVVIGAAWAGEAVWVLHQTATGEAFTNAWWRWAATDGFVPLLTAIAVVTTCMVALRSVANDRAKTFTDASTPVGRARAAQSLRRLVGTSAGLSLVIGALAALTCRAVLVDRSERLPVVVLYLPVVAVVGVVAAEVSVVAAESEAALAIVEYPRWRKRMRVARGCWPWPKGASTWLLAAVLLSAGVAANSLAQWTWLRHGPMSWPDALLLGGVLLLLSIALLVPVITVWALGYRHRAACGLFVWLCATILPLSPLLSRRNVLALSEAIVPMLMAPALAAILALPWCGRPSTSHRCRVARAAPTAVVVALFLAWLQRLREDQIQRVFAVYASEPRPPARRDG